jgi:hypothetical protein
MLDASRLPKYLWAEAWLHSVWLRNRAPTSALPEAKTPHEMGTGEKPNLANLIEFGRKVWVKPKKSPKLTNPAVEGHFVGYNDETKDGLRIYWPGKHLVTVERDVSFNKNDVAPHKSVQIEGGEESINSPTFTAPAAPEKPQDDGMTPQRDNNNEKSKTSETHLEPDPTPAESTPITNPAPPEPPASPPHQRRVWRNGLFEPEPDTGHGQRLRPAPGFYKKLQRTAGVVEEEQAETAFVVDDDEFGEPGGVGMDEDGGEWLSYTYEFTLAAEGGDSTPMTVGDTLASPKAEAWSAAIEAELDGIEKHETWEIVEAPPGANIIKCRYVFKVKRDAVSAIAKYKAQLVAKGFTQIFGIDYDVTYAPVVKLETLCLLLSFAASNGSVIHQADIKNAYLNAELKEELYMELPPHYNKFRTLPPEIQAQRDAGHRIIVKLKKGLYGTKQGARKWYQKLSSVFLSLGFTICSADEAVFYKYSGDHYTIVASAVDDFTIIADTLDAAELIKKQLNDHFELVDLGEINWLLGFTVT